MRVLGRFWKGSTVKAAQQISLGDSGLMVYLSPLTPGTFLSAFTHVPSSNIQLNPHSLNQVPLPVGRPQMFPIATSSATATGCTSGSPGHRCVWARLLPEAGVHRAASWPRRLCYTDIEEARPHHNITSTWECLARNR